MIFADLTGATPEVVVIGGILVGLAATAKCANEIADFAKRFRDPKPTDEQVGELKSWIEKTFSTKEELLHAKELFATTLVNQDTRITLIRTEISALVLLVNTNEERHEEREKRNEQRIVDLHNRINPLLEVTGAMKERLRAHSQSLHRREGQNP